jgi:hypothetical protein
MTRHRGTTRGARAQSSFAHSAAGPRALSSTGAPDPGPLQRRVELGHQLGQRLHRQPLLHAHARASLSGGVRGGELLHDRVAAASRPHAHRNGGTDRFVTLGLHAERNAPSARWRARESWRAALAQRCHGSSAFRMRMKRMFAVRCARRGMGQASHKRSTSARGVAQASSRDGVRGGTTSGRVRAPSPWPYDRKAPRGWPAADAYRRAHQQHDNVAPVTLFGVVEGGLAALCSARRPLGSPTARHAAPPARAVAADTHTVLRVDVRAEPHELGGRGGPAVASSEHERSPAILQHATAQRSATCAAKRPNLNSHTRPASIDMARRSDKTLRPGNTRCSSR